jgi:phosphoglucose isomerase-like protein
MLHDASDNPRIVKRMQVAADMLIERGIALSHVALDGGGFTKAFKAALLADWVSLELAAHYKVPNPETPMVAEFKQRISQ